jgi:hypothetical protein
MARTRPQVNLSSLVEHIFSTPNSISTFANIGVFRKEEVDTLFAYILTRNIYWCF